MKKLLPCRLLTTLLLFVAFLATPNLFAQCDANATPRFVCAGPGNNIIYTTASVLLADGTTLTWTITGDSTGGAKFVNNGSTVSTTTISNGLVNSVLVLLGPLSGSTEVRMSIPGDPPGTGCAASVFTKVVVVQGSAPAVVCHDDTTTVSINAALTGTKIGTSQTITQLPGACGQYTYSLVTSPGGVVVATNNTGVFPSATPQDYVIRITDCDGCTATSPVIHIVNPPANPVHATCPGDLHLDACKYTQAEIDQKYADWKLLFQYSGGTQPITRNFIGDDALAPKLCNNKQLLRLEVSDVCKTFDACQATFYVDPPAPVVPPTIIDKTVKACDVIDTTVLAKIISDYEATLLATGGCAPKITWDPYINPERLCGSTINLVGHIIDKCDVNIPILAHLIIESPTPVQYNAPANESKPACFYKDNTEVVNAYGTWFHQFTITPGTGCDPQIKLEQGPVPDFCGGTTSVTATITDKCIDPIVITRFFSIDKPTDWVIKNCPGDVKLACNPKEEDFPGVITLTTDSQCPTTQDVKDVVTHTDCFYTLTRTYTVKTSCDLVGKTCVQKITYKVDLVAPIITCSANKDVACNATVVFNTPTATDNCTATANIIITAGAEVIVSNPDGSVSHTKSWTATDDCNNVSTSCSQTIRVLSCATGCTLGYWKNHTDRWCSDYKTCTLYKDVFSGSTLPANLTLLQALNLMGNTACENLGRQSVAALLNICNGMPFSIGTIADLKTQVNAAFAGGTCNALGATLDGFNSLGAGTALGHCPLSGSKATVIPSPGCPGGASISGTKKGVNATGEVAPTTTFKAYPNPFTNSFFIQSSNTIHPLEISIFDNIGRSIETRVVNPSEFDFTSFGSGYPTGIYNIIFNQATEQKSLRVIKQ